MGFRLLLPGRAVYRAILKLNIGVFSAPQSRSQIGRSISGPISSLASADAQIFSRVQPVRTPQIAFTKYFRVQPQ